MLSSPSGPKTPSIVSLAPLGRSAASARHGIHNIRSSPRAILVALDPSRQQEDDEELGQQDRDQRDADKADGETHAGRVSGPAGRRLWSRAGSGGWSSPAVDAASGRWS